MTNPISRRGLFSWPFQRVKKPNLEVSSTAFSKIDRRTFIIFAGSAIAALHGCGRRMANNLWELRKSLSVDLFDVVGKPFVTKSIKLTIPELIPPSKEFNKLLITVEVDKAGLELQSGILNKGNLSVKITDKVDSPPEFGIQGLAPFEEITPKNILEQNGLSLSTVRENTKEISYSRLMVKVKRYYKHINKNTGKEEYLPINAYYGEDKEGRRELLLEYVSIPDVGLARLIRNNKGEVENVEEINTSVRKTLENLYLQYGSRFEKIEKSDSFAKCIVEPKKGEGFDWEVVEVLPDNTAEAQRLFIPAKQSVPKAQVEESYGKKIDPLPIYIGNPWGTVAMPGWPEGKIDVRGQQERKQLVAGQKVEIQIAYNVLDKDAILHETEIYLPLVFMTQSAIPGVYGGANIYITVKLVK